MSGCPPNFIILQWKVTENITVDPVAIFSNGKNINSFTLMFFKWQLACDKLSVYSRECDYINDEWNTTIGQLNCAPYWGSIQGLPGLQKFSRNPLSQLVLLHCVSLCRIIFIIMKTHISDPRFLLLAPSTLVKYIESVGSHCRWNNFNLPCVYLLKYC